MGCGQNLKFTQPLDRISILVLFLLISFSTHLRLIAQGRPLVVNENERGIGSRPPRCEIRKCSSSSCVHCEAVQVPTNPNIKHGISTNIVATIVYSRSRGDAYYSNYKPMSWKCKCGNFIFNP